MGAKTIAVKCKLMCKARTLPQHLKNNMHTAAAPTHAFEQVKSVYNSGNTYVIVYAEEQRHQSS